MKESPKADREKKEAMDHARRRYAETGNLSQAEIDEMIGYDFVAGPATVRAQVRRYYLMVKENRPKKAECLLMEAERLPLDSIHTDEDAYNLCILLSHHINGFVVYPELTQEVQDELAREYPLPLKTITAKAERPYAVWHHGASAQAQWKAWRQGRPTILGYGMSEEEAVNDLRYVVQPDHDGTLDGLGQPKGCVIGGNMIPANQMIAHNKRRFTSQG